jgi:hypothetical protein
MRDDKIFGWFIKFANGSVSKSVYAMSEQDAEQRLGEEITRHFVYNRDLRIVNAGIRIIV